LVLKIRFGASHRHSCTDGGEILRGRVAMHAASLLPSDGFVEEGPRDATNTKTVMSHSRYAITHPFNGPLSRTTRVGRYQKGKTNLDFTEARDSEWQ